MILASDHERAIFEAGRQEGIRETLTCVGAVMEVDPQSLISARTPKAGLTMATLESRIAAAPNPAAFRVLRPFDRADAIEIKQAAAHAGVSESTIREWTARFYLGRKRGGRWWLSRRALDAFVNGDARALAACLFGDPAAALA